MSNMNDFDSLIYFQYVSYFFLILKAKEHERQELRSGGWKDKRLRFCCGGFSVNE